MVVCLGQNAFAGTPTPKDLKTDQNSHKKKQKTKNNPTNTWCICIVEMKLAMKGSLNPHDCAGCSMATAMLRFSENTIRKHSASKIR